ncbi:MAG TPA: hypothetical protein VLL72_01245 [Kiloniellales bacterium]|nr:hypothetical protein [Kiloniellales bacterium]
MDIGYLERQVEDGRRRLAEASSESTASAEQLIGVMRHLEESLSGTWELLQENEARRQALMEEYRRLTGLLVTVGDALRAGAPGQIASNGQEAGRSAVPVDDFTENRDSNEGAPANRTASGKGRRGAVELMPVPSADDEGAFDPEVFRAGVQRLLARRERAAENNAKAIDKGAERPKKRSESATPAE